MKAIKYILAIPAIVIYSIIMLFACIYGNYTFDTNRFKLACRCFKSSMKQDWTLYGSIYQTHYFFQSSRRFA